MSKHQGFSAIALIIIIAVLGIGGYFVWKNQTVTPPSALPKGEGTSTSPLGGGLPAGEAGSEGVDTANWKTYRNEKYGFEFKYPTQLIVTEDKNTIGTPECLSSIEFYDKQELENLLDGDVQSYLDLCVAKSLAEAQNDFGVQWEPSVLDNKPAMKGMVTTLPVLLVELVGDKGLTLYSSRSENLLDQILSTFRFVK